jgi:2-polyprenyl-3-methyl-5-hydroxy-6-metoxy-1,4-benzoquinol methylase
MAQPLRDSNAAYNQWHDRLGIETEARCPWHELIREGLPGIGGLGGKKILEIGCGRGGFSLWMASQQPAPAVVVAADFSERAVELGSEAASGLGIRGIQWEVQDIQRIRHPENSFDLVVSCETIEHVPDPALAVRELARVLKPGGHLMLTHPNYLSTFGLYRAYVTLRGREFTEEGQPINHPLRVTKVLEWVREAGLRCDHFTGRGQYWFFPGRVPVELRWAEKPRWLMRWFGFHPLIVACKPG